MMPDRDIEIRSGLTIKNAFLFPIQNKIARRELLFGALFFAIPPLGWIVNMGHRMNIVHHHHSGAPLWPGWTGWRRILINGCVGALAFFVYMGPGVLLSLLSWLYGFAAGTVVGILLAAVGTFLIPGFMTYYCVAFDIGEIFALRKTLKRIRIGWRSYLKAWGIVLISALISLAGLLVFLVGFFVTTVWNWQVAAYCFCSACAEIEVD